MWTEHKSTFIKMFHVTFIYALYCTMSWGLSEHPHKIFFSLCAPAHVFYSTCRHLFIAKHKSSALNTKSFYILGNTFYIFNISGKQDVKDFVQTNSMTDKLNFNLTVVLTTKWKNKVCWLMLYNGTTDILPLMIMSKRVFVLNITFTWLYQPSL